MHTHGRVLVLAAGLALAACKSGTEERIAELDAAASWLATVQEVGLTWSENRLPTKFAERTMDQAREALVQSDEAHAASIAWRARDVVRRGDRTAMADVVDAAHEEQRTIEHKLDELKKTQ